jgi:hypothetical protein
LFYLSYFHFSNLIENMHKYAKIFLLISKKHTYTFVLEVEINVVSMMLCKIVDLRNCSG